MNNMKICFFNIIILFFLICTSTNLCSQTNKSQCLNYLYLKIEKNGHYPQSDNFPIYFMNEDSIFKYNRNLQICVDSGDIKKFTVFFYYDNRVIQCPVYFVYPDAQNMSIRYYKISDFNIASKNEIKKFCNMNDINKRIFSNTDILYFGDITYGDYFGLATPISYWNKRRINVDELYYGIVKITVGRINFIAFDYKPKPYIIW